MATADDPVEVAWARVRADFQDDARHKQFIALAQSLGRMPEAGRRYREVLSTSADEAERAQAQRQIDRLLAAAMASMASLKAPADVGRTRLMLLWVASAVMLALIAGVTFLALRGMGAPPPP